jgi:hypothetical protein
MEKIKLNKRIYLKKAVLESITTFEKNCKIDIEEDEAYLTLTFNTETDQHSTIAHEFANYCLAETKNHGN